MSFQTMLSAVREAIKDNRYSSTALTVQCNDQNVQTCLLEITDGMLMTTVTGNGSGDPPVAQNLSFNLENDAYATIGGLYRAFSIAPGYTANLPQLSEVDHESTDIDQTPGPVDIKVNGYDLRVRMFSDAELEAILTRVISRHNPSFGQNSVPIGEEPLVVTLAQAEIFRIFANDATKRKGMDATVEEVVAVAKSYEDLYDRDTKRLMRVISPPRETAESIGGGDIMVGELTRSSLRTGYATSISDALGSDTPVIWDPNQLNVIEDTRVELYWSRKKPADYLRTEVWRDTRPNVQRTRDRNVKPTTSVLVATVRGYIVDSIIDATLEPETAYYYRVYLLDSNGESVESEVLSVTTLPLRTTFSENSLSAVAGVSGSPLAIGLSSYVNGVTKVDMDGKLLTGSWDPVAGTFTVLVPTFINPGPKDIVVTSGTGLFDILPQAFNVLA